LQRLIDLDTASTKVHTSDAAVVASQLLRGVASRFAHSAMVAQQADRVGHLVGRRWGSAPTEAAWLHDVGYSRKLVSTGFHPLDGARWLRDHGWPIETCRLVAWHTAAEVEAQLRAMDENLGGEFEPPLPIAAAALTWSDLTSSATGERCTVDCRLADILRRSAADSVVYRATIASLPALREAANEIESLLAQTGGAS
jgi:hypothetical protein